MPQLITEPARIPVPGGKIISEHVGLMSTGTLAVSVAHMMAPANWGEPFQTPEFDEITLVLKGSVIVDHQGGPITAHAGQSILTGAGERVRYSCGPDGAEYVAICLPAFGPDTVNREDLVLTDDILLRAPKALLHDHLDGGLRPQTIVALDASIGYQGLPAQEADALGAWFRASANSGSLERYLETFSQTLVVMQTVDGLHRVASECVQDLAADGVVYAEVRYAPELHLVDDLSLEDVVEAVNAGFRDGERLAAEAGHRIRVTALLTAMRQAAKGTEIAELVVRYRDDG